LRIARPSSENFAVSTTGFVAVVERVEPVPPVQLEPRLGRAEDRHAPVAAAGVRDERVHQPVECFRRSDRITGDDRDAADDAVGEERGLVGAEEERLVGAENERCERVRSPRAHELQRERTLARFLHDAMPPGREPEREQPDAR
jgi:hypothetical protein